MKTLQEQYNLIKEGKGHKGVFLTEAKKQFPSMLTNPMGFDEATKILKTRGVISENYVDLKPINTIESSSKAVWETKFAKFLAEETKAEVKKPSEEVEETQSHNYDYKDKSNLDNQIGQEVLNGVYFEAKENPGKTLDEIRKMVSKNLAKDGQYYMKNAAFGVKGLGYKETEIEEVTGKYASSGYSDKLKKLVKESLVKEQYIFSMAETAEELANTLHGRYDFATDYIDSGDQRREAIKTNERIKEWFNAHPEEIKQEAYTILTTKNPSLTGDLNKIMSKNVSENENIPSKPKSSPKKESLDDMLSEIEAQAQIVAMEAKLDKISEMISSKMERLGMIEEDTNLAELVDKGKMKAMQKEIKVLEKRKAKMEKIYEKATGKAYTKEMVDEDQAYDEVEEGIHDKDILSAPHTNVKTPPKGVGEYDPAKRAASLKRLANFGPKK